MLLKSILIFTTIISLSFTCSSQDIGTTNIEIVGLWSVQDIKPELEFAQMMFGQSVMTINQDSTFSLTMGNEKMSETSVGKWTAKNGNVLLNSENLPGPILLEDISRDNCTWDAKELKFKIVFARVK